ncbi:MAG TPA: hypothetical protein VLC91_00775 [Spongiibacteraceae bacterium]|nr:hypothetical protein [Spongiibacteraceae bacterium]
MLYEILETSDGDIVLRRIEGDTEPLVRIRFSEPARAHLADAGLLVAKAMVEAGIRAFNELHQEPGIDSAAQQPRQLH